MQIVNPPSTGVTGQAVSFSAATAIAQNAGASISSYTWSFGDGGAGSGQTVSHTYATPGAYSVGLTVSTSAGTTANASTSITVAAAAPPGMSIVVAAGWNLIGGPNATIVSGNGGSLYTYQAGDGAYEVIPNGAPLKAGEGYWVYFPTAGTTTIPLVSAQPTSIQAPAGQFIMIGNPTDGNVKVSGADIVFAYSASGSYQQTTTIAAGMGAWAYSAHGGAVTLTPSP
ncbi:MAG TPA: PKD domain-containing protein [Solirubrobacteraceae bacterium]|nr:PKD domain-containing protein [Solirubrobacteraceae bacterium]